MTTFINPVRTTYYYRHYPSNIGKLKFAEEERPENEALGAVMTKIW